MTEVFSFSLKNNFKSNNSFHNLNFSSGLNVVYGESGVGKSELIKCLSGDDCIKSDKFKIKDISVVDRIQVIQQNPEMQIISNTIKNELAFNFECSSNETIQIQKEFNSIIKKLLFNVDINRHPATLSGGEKELLNISTAFSLNPQVILIDDALSFLNSTMKAKVVSQLNELSNTIIMWFTSDSRDLHYGKTKWEMTDSGISENKINHQFDLPILKSHIGKISLLISDLKFAYGNNELIFNKFSNNISDFRCLGIVGNNGSGKSTLASLLLNIEEPISGLINLMINESNVPEIGYLDQFPEKLLGIMTINDFLNSLLNNSKLKSSNIVKFKSDLKSNNIDWDLVKNKTRFELSWTELRFILICILSNCNYDLLILDEPTFGMGNKQKLNLHSYFVRYLNKKHLILISHDKSFVNSLCDSIIKL